MLRLDIRRQHKKDSKDDLQQAKEMIDKRDGSTDSTQHHLFGFGKHLDKVLNSCSDSERQLNEVQQLPFVRAPERAYQCFSAATQ